MKIFIFILLSMPILSNAQMCTFKNVGTGASVSLSTAKQSGFIDASVPHIAFLLRRNFIQNEAANSSMSMNLLTSLGGSVDLGGGFNVGFSSESYISTYIPLTVEYNVGADALHSSDNIFGASIGGGLSRLL
jgi:hypothetical protein